MTERVYRIRGAQVRCFDPLVVRYRCNPDVHLHLRGEDTGGYRDKGVVHVVVDAKDGVPEITDNLPRMQDDYFPDFTEFVFLGAVKAESDGKYLVVRSRGDIHVTAGADLLPVDASRLGAADVLEWIANDYDDDPPHKP